MLIIFLVVVSTGCGAGGGGGSKVSGSSAGVASGGPSGTTSTGTSTGTGTGTWNGVRGIADPLQCPLNTYSPNYCQEIDPARNIPNEFHWWDLLPIKVYFTTAPTIQGQSINTLVLAGFNAWGIVTGGPIAVAVNSSAEAQVTVRYENTPTQPPGWIGHATWSLNPFNRQAISGTVTLKTWDSMSMAEVVDGLRRIAQHEFGHILFISGHSTAWEDTMARAGPTNAYVPLSVRDQFSFKTAYCGTFGGPNGIGSLGALGGMIPPGGLITQSIED